MLQQVINEIKALTPVANEEVLEQPRETLGGRMARQRNAQVRLRDLREQYAQQLLRTSAFIVVSGPNAQNFADKAVSDFGCFSASTDAFFTDLADRVAPSLYVNKLSGSGLIDVVSRHLEDKAHDLGILEYPQAQFKSQHARAITDKADFVNHLKDVYLEQLGGEIVGIQSVRSMVDSAIERGHNSSLTPIVLVTSEADVNVVTKGLLRITNRVTQLNAATQMTDEDVPNMMTYVRDQIFAGQGFVHHPSTMEKTPVETKTASVSKAKSKKTRS